MPGATPKPTAVCYKDDEPLVLTFEVPGQEFVCVRCGARYTYFGPKALPTTPELDARHEENKKLFDEQRQKPAEDPRT